MTWQPDPEFDKQAERQIRQHVTAIFGAREQALQDVEADVIGRNLAGSGIHLQLVRDKWAELFHKHADAVMSDLIGLVERHAVLSSESKAWIWTTFETHADGLARGMARTLDDVMSRWRIRPADSAATWERIRDSAKSKAKLRLEMAVGEAGLKSRMHMEAEVSAKIDVFISHASEDKDAVARPLAEELKRRGFSVWYDEYVLKLGDSLPAEIDRGLAKSRFGVVILSPRFFAKNWPRRELDGLAAREVRGGRKVILPVWHEVDVTEVERHSPTLAAKLAVSTSKGLGTVVERIVEVLEPGRTNPAEPVRQEPHGTTTTDRGAASAEEPVQIIGIVEGEVGRPRNDGTAGSALYPVSLRLSRTPSRVWAELFVETWNRPPQFTSRHRPGIASVVGDRIVLARTTIEELEEVHRETLRHVLARVNEEAARIEASERKRAAANAEAQREHDEQVRAAAKRLRFD
jgi:hypothetical protein